jgi:hypothetical protein
MILAIFLSIIAPCCATIEETSLILNASQGLVEGEGHFSYIGTFIEALDSLEGLTLQIGSRGNHVAAFQSLLITSGYLPEGEDDGIYGKKSAAAVEKFQLTAGLKPTGKATLTTQFMIVIANSDLVTREEGIYMAQIDNYAVVIWPNYSFFIGVLETDGDLDYGTYYFASGDYYVGDFKDDCRHGKGIAYHSNGDIYVGDWSKDVMSGNGIYYFDGMDSGEYYDGEWANNMMNGKGVYVTASGNEITGSWQNNRHKGW